nr:NAD(P)H-dependent glycerol-3-phosphate dehydrogenase [Limnohabitans sp.]
MKLLVLGAGAWGTALAAQASARHEVTLWARNPAIIQDMQTRGVNQRYLPGQSLPPALHLSHAPLAQLLPHTDLVVLASPMAALRDMLLATAPMLGERPLAWLCKGFEAVLPSIANPKAKHGLLAHEVQLQVAPALQAGILSGPSFAKEVAAGQPAALVAASVHPAVRDALVQAFHGDNLRVYANEDIVGVEVGGAVKNVMAIATGLCDGLQLGL